jgi:Ni,Fe-hydrogenase III large subunit
MQAIEIENNQSVPLALIPEFDYNDFFESNLGLVADHPENHCVSYFGWKENKLLRLFCCIADDLTGKIYISSCRVDPRDKLEAFTSRHLSFANFERELHEYSGVDFSGHPWLKPLRYPCDRVDQSAEIASYPFYHIDSDELHEVGVGPIHAGVIEPGHFRFICNGEQILHLEMQMGYQHRGVEQLFQDKKKLLQKVTLAEAIAGDSVAGHTSAFCQVWESLCGMTLPGEIQLARTIAQELERIAVHTGDLAALCADIAYQLGSAVYGRLRTPLINFFQEWGGNRLAKGLIRPGYQPYPFTMDLAERLKTVLEAFEPDFEEMSHQLFKLPSALSRFERTGIVSLTDLEAVGAVGMTARMGGLTRDIRYSHPYGHYHRLNHQPIVKRHGDVYSRVQIRRKEVQQSLAYLRQMAGEIRVVMPGNTPLTKPRGDRFSISLVEGWRGEICHCAITDASGDLVRYKIKDPSFHNWMVLALAVRNNEISDFPVCNKSFNLSYCGFDL